MTLSDRFLMMWLFKGEKCEFGLNDFLKNQLIRLYSEVMGHYFIFVSFGKCRSSVNKKFVKAFKVTLN